MNAPAEHGSPQLRMELFTPLEKRIALENPELLNGLQMLKNSLGEEVYQKHINNLQGIKRNADTVLLLTRSEMQRTHIMACYTQQIREAFAVQHVRVTFVSPV